MSHNYRAPPVPPRPRPTHPPYVSSHEEPVHRPGPSRNSSTTTIRQRPSVQIPIPHIPSGAQPAINPASVSAVTDSLQKARIADNARPRHGSYAPPPELYENHHRPNPYEQNGRLAAGPPLSPLSRSWSAEPGASQLHLQPRTADGQPPRPMPGSRPRTDYENVSHAWGGHPQTSHVPGGKPWEGSAFTVGSHVDLGDDYEWDSGYGGSSQGHGGKGKAPRRSQDSHASGSGQQEWSKNRWGMDSETSFETASNAEQIGTGVLADQVSAAESGLDRLSLFHTAASLEFDEWAYVVPEEARNILDHDEIQRQSNIYELIKSERNFVISMQIFLYIFRDGLLYANPPIIPQRDKLERFVHEVFFNAQEILSIHLHLRDLLYERQRDQHPIIHSVADIYLRWLLEHKEPYTRFQKHLPKSFNYHKTELRHNASYRNFFNDVSKLLTDIRNAGMDDSSVPRLEDSTKPTLEFLIGRINKQDFDTFLHGFNTRFTRLELQFTTMAKRTAKDHPDVCGDSAPIPLITSTLKQVLRIASVELQTLQNRVEFENFCKKLHFRKGEIIDLDWYDEHRQLFMHGPLARRNRRDVEWHGWSDLYVGLLDNYLVVTKDVSAGGREQNNVVSRPIPLDYLRLAKPYNAPPETRRPEGCIIRDKLLGDSVPMYPFTVYHVADPSDRRYTFYTETEALRTQWLNAFNEAMIIRNTYQSENKFFAVNPLSGRRFNTKTVLVPSENIVKFDWLGQVYAAAPFAFEGDHYILYSTSAGIYLGLRHRPEGIQKVMRFTEVTQMAALHSLEKVVLLANESLYAYPFQSLVRVWRREADMSELGVSGDRLSRSRDGAVQFFRAGMCEGRMLIGYATKSIIHLHLHFLEALGEPVGSPVTSTRGFMNKISTSTKESPSKSFPSFGQTLTVPRDATDLAMLTKRIVVMCQSQVVIVDPQDPAMKAYPVPDFMVNPSVEYGSAEAISGLKDRCSKSKALGMVLSRSKELMIVYADFGCYVTKYGAPARQSAFVRWETRATSVAFRWPHALLFSPNYIEIRNVESGGLVQVIQERDVRLLYPGPPHQGPILAAMRGEDDVRGKTDRVVELLETAPIEVDQGEPSDDTLWREWDV